MIFKRKLYKVGRVGKYMRNIKGMSNTKKIFSFIGIGIFVLLLILFLFSQSFRNYIIPLSLIILGAVGIFLNTQNKSFSKGYVFNYIMIVLMVASLGFLIYNSAIQSSYNGYEVIGAYTYGTIDCSPAVGGEKFSGWFDTSQGNWIDPIKNTDEYSIYMKYNNIDSLDTGIFTYPVVGLEYYQCDTKYFTNCDEPKVVLTKDNVDQKLIVNGLDANRYTRFEFQYANALNSWIADFTLGYKVGDLVGINLKTDTSRNGQINLRYTPYVLWRDDVLQGGKNMIAGSNDCSFPLKQNNFLGAVIKTTDPKLTDFNIKDYLALDEAYNYISGVTLTVNNGEALSYKGTEGYCIDDGNKATVYGFDEIETSEGNKYKVVDSSKVLGTEECCSGLDYGSLETCNDYKFTYVKYNATYDDNGNIIGATSNIECSLLNPLPTGKQVYGSDTSFVYNCVDGYAVLTNFKNEECALNSDCSNGEVCNNFKCVDANNPELSQDLTEQQKASQCSQFQDYSPIYKKSWLFGKSTSTGEYSCQLKDSYKILSWIGGILLIIGIGVFANPNRKKLSQKSKKGRN